MFFPLFGIANLLSQPVILPPVEWIEASVDLTNDPTSAASGLVKLDPYQVEPIKAQFDPAGILNPGKLLPDPGD